MHAQFFLFSLGIASSVRPSADACARVHAHGAQPGHPEPITRPCTHISCSSLTWHTPSHSHTCICPHADARTGVHAYGAQPGHHGHPGLVHPWGGGCAPRRHAASHRWGTRSLFLVFTLARRLPSSLSRMRWSARGWAAANVYGGDTFRLRRRPCILCPAPPRPKHTLTHTHCLSLSLSLTMEIISKT